MSPLITLGEAEAWPQSNDESDQRTTQETEELKSTRFDHSP